MYIHKKSLINNKITDINSYKKKLSILSDINTKRFNKLTVLALLGASQCMENTKFSDNLGIYISSEYGSIQSIKTALDEYRETKFLMPFNFLNINTNNIGFHVSKALNSSGKNMVLGSHDLAFEKAIELAIFDLETNEVKDIIIGHIDESLSGIVEYNSTISNIQQSESKDTSGWLYINNEQSSDSLAKIERISNFNKPEILNQNISSIDFDLVYLNQFGLKNIDILSIEKNKVFIPKNKNVHSCTGMIELLEMDFTRALHIAMDQKRRSYLIEFIK